MNKIREIEEMKYYFSGNGLDISKSSEIGSAKHYFTERNGLFSLQEAGERESFDFVYICDLTETKFYPIILKEMLYSARVGGFIVIEQKNNSHVSFKQLAREAKLYLKDKAGIRAEDKKNKILVFQKIKKCLERGDSIDKISFGMISGGNKIEQIDKQIEIIRKLKIPHYEIIICGKYKETADKDISYIYFDKFDKGWITAQKNKIPEKARYENLVLMHDRIMPNSDFYSGLKKYGNYFEVLSCKIVNDRGERCGDWMSYGNEFNKLPRIGNLQYEDWDKNVWIDGAFYIMKKSIWKKVQFDEALFWNQGEDRKMAEDWKAYGIVPGFNPYSSCLTLSWRHGVLPDFEFNDKWLGKRKASYINKIRELGRFYIKPIIRNN